MLCVFKIIFEKEKNSKHSLTVKKKARIKNK